MKCFFLDRDGVIINDVEGKITPANAVLCPGVPEALKMIKKAGYKIVIVSNQSVIAEGILTPEELAETEKHIEECLKAAGAPLPDKWCYCPHFAAGIIPAYSFQCSCRKPAPGMIKNAAWELNIDISKSFMIGDRITDIQAGINAGCRKCAMVLTGYSKESDAVPLEQDYEVAKDLPAAVAKFLNQYE